MPRPTASGARRDAQEYTRAFGAGVQQDSEKRQSLCRAFRLGRVDDQAELVDNALRSEQSSSTGLLVLRDEENVIEEAQIPVGGLEREAKGHYRQQFGADAWC